MFIPARSKREEQREILEVKILELEDQRFYLAMKDRWTSEDYEHDYKLQTEILKLEVLLK